MEQDKSAPTSEKFPMPTMQWNDVLQVLGSVAGFIGIGGGLLWLFGRYYYSGVFSAFGFSSLPISLATEDYLETGSSRLLYLVMDILITIFLYYLAYLAKILYYERISGSIKSHLLNITLILFVFSISVIGGAFLISTSKLGISASYFYEDSINFLGIFLMFLGLEVAFLIASPVGSKYNTEPFQSQLIFSLRLLLLLRAY